MGFLFASLSILLVTFAQLAMKVGMSKLPLASGLFELLDVMLHNLGATALVFAGLLAYAFSLGAWLLALTRLPLNRAYPLLSISYALVYLLAVALPWFNDTLSLQRVAGVALVVVGVLLINWRPAKTA